MDELNEKDRQEIANKRKNNIGVLFKYASRDFNQRALDKLRKYGYPELTLFHTSLISNLDIEGTRISILAKRANISKQAMGQVVSDLEKEGYIRRTADPNDQRAFIIHFTTKGWEFLKVAYDVKSEIEAEYIQIIGEQGMKELEHLLSKIVEYGEIVE
jgi:DNA-binding MarR family transcriptional regulator